MSGFPSIGQFRNAKAEVKWRAQYVGKDEDGNPLTDESIPLPTLRVVGTVKIHGTNAGVALRNGEVIAFSRNQEASTIGGLYGFSEFVRNNDQAFRDLFKMVDNTSAEFRGEWCGKGVPTGKVAVNDLEKMFVIFGVLIDDKWYDIRSFRDVESPDARIFNITRFGIFEAEVDFESPEQSLKVLEAITLDVERECPVGKYFGVEGVGEGVVWKIQDPRYDESKFWFKVKGLAHQVAQTKAVIEVDPEVATSIQEFVNMTVTEPRLLQGAGLYPFSTKATGDFLRWVYDDIVREESDRLEASGLTPKDVSKALSTKARKWWFTHLTHLGG